MPLASTTLPTARCRRYSLIGPELLIAAPMVAAGGREVRRGDNLALDVARMGARIELAQDALAPAGPLPCAQGRVARIPDHRVGEASDRRGARALLGACGRLEVDELPRRPSSISTTPPTANATTGLAIAIDSITARGNGSAYTLGTTATSKSAISGRTSARNPSMRNRSPRPSESASCPALLDMVGPVVFGRVAHDDERDAPAGVRAHRVERQARRAHHLDVALATQHAPVATEDDRVAREP